MFALLSATVDVNNTLYLRVHSTRGCTYDDYDSKCAKKVPIQCFWLLPNFVRCA